MKKRSWKTTVSGALAALGMYLKDIKDPSWMSPLGEALVAIGTFGVGYFARDNNVTSEEVGVK